MIQVTLYISFWCNLATPCEYVSFMYLNQPAQKSNERCITSMLCILPLRLFDLSSNIQLNDKSIFTHNKR